MTWSTAGISRPLAAMSVARRTELGVDLNLQEKKKEPHCLDSEMQDRYWNAEPIQIFEALSLF